MEVLMEDNKPSKTAKQKTDQVSDKNNPVKVVRQGAIAASIWLRQAPTGFPYYDFTISRSWKSVAGGKTGYSQNFFDRNKSELLQVIEGACTWIAEQQDQVIEDGGFSATAA
jgi:hypothetical protein